MDPEHLVSRFVRDGDPSADTVVWPLPAAWWSRGREYAWAQRFAGPEHIVLDAACGVSHPFKFWLAKNTKKCVAVDNDPRLVDNRALLTAVAEDFGQVAVALSAGQPKDGAIFGPVPDRFISDITDLPCDDSSFDRVFCISVLEHMLPDAMVEALDEFRRVLRVGGLLVLTFDVPPIAPTQIVEVVGHTGLRFAGPVEITQPPDALFTNMWGGIRCFRVLLQK